MITNPISSNVQRVPKPLFVPDITLKESPPGLILVSYLKDLLSYDFHTR